MAELVREHFDPVLGKVPGIVVATLAGGDEHVLALGSVASHQSPRQDCWEIGR